MNMVENGSDRQEEFQRALTTLSRFLPNHYQKDSVANILRGAIDYIEILNKSLAEPKSHATADVLVQYSTVTDLDMDFTNISMSHLDDFLEKELNCVFDEDTFTDAEPYQSARLPPFEEPDIENKRYEIKRPPNGFIRFSADKRRELHLMFPNTDNREISKYLGQMWQQMSRAEKSYYVDAFYTEMDNIKSRFPEWNYAASRAKCAVQSRDQMMAEQVMLPTRLRPRQILDFKEYEQTEVFEEENTTKKKKTKKTKKKPISLAKQDAEAVLWVQCDLCKKWRKLPQNYELQDLPKTWWCSMNPNVFFSKCSIAQEN